MEIKIFSIGDIKKVNKPWGWERWIADGRPNFPYVLKELFIKAGHRLSLQFHQFKQETSYVQKGEGILYYSATAIDTARYIRGGYTPQELKELIKSLKQTKISAASVFHMSPGFIHRVEATEDLLIVESSTVELDDIYRLEDDAHRAHGRIESEHQ